MDRATYLAEWRKANPEKVKAKNKRWAEKNKERKYEINRRSLLKRTYGITPEQYDEMFEEQQGMCAICGTTEPHPSGKWRHFAVDHDHETDAIRGLLCSSCNSGIGLLGDDISTLKAAINYLEKHI